MADGVGEALNSFWTLVNNWKKGKSADLPFHSENGRLTVKYSMDLGVWVPPSRAPTPRPPSDSACRGHQGSRKGASPSRQRRRERRAAARAAEADATENVSEASPAPKERAEEAETSIINKAATPEELHTTPEQGDTSHTLSPGRAVREEEGDQCEESFENHEKCGSDYHIEDCHCEDKIPQIDGEIDHNAEEEDAQVKKIIVNQIRKV